MMTNMVVTKQAERGEVPEAGSSEAKPRPAGNNRVRLEAARRTTAELEGSRKDNAAS